MQITSTVLALIEQRVFFVVSQSKFGKCHAITMKRIVVILVVPWIFLRAQQLFSPYTAAEGINPAVRAAQQSGVIVSGVDGILTTGDSTLLAQLGSLGSTLQLRFDFQRGTNTLWVYSVKGTLNGRDTSIYYLVTKLFTLYQAIPLFGTPGLDQLGRLRGTQTLPSTFLNSDVLMQKLMANARFQEFRQRYPTSVIQGASLSITPYADYIFGNTVAMWSVVVSRGTLLSPELPILDCYVHATDPSQAAICYEVGTTSAAEENYTHTWQLHPTPAEDVVFLKIPANAVSSTATIEVIHSNGVCLATYSVGDCGVGEAIAVPVSSLPSGVYMLRYRTLRYVKTLPFVVSR